jgi:glucokinase
MLQQADRNPMGSLTMVRENDLYPWLVADIGGTNARFGLVRGQNAPVDNIVAVKCADFKTPEDAAASYLDTIATREGVRPQPKVAAYAAAAAIHGDTVRLTNSNWTISRPATMSALGATLVLLLNDFEALALALPHLSDDDAKALGPGIPDRNRPMAVIGPGTGLGVALCVPAGKGRGWVAIAGEGGHATLAPADDFEDDVLRHVRREFDHISGERLLSGIGLPVLHKAVAAVRGEPQETLTAEEISRRAFAPGGGHAGCLATLDTFCAMFGTFAGNLALTGGAGGGLFVAGGIAQKLGDFFARSRFRARFEAKGRFRSYMAAIATRLITAPYCALRGAAQGIEQELGAQ